MPDERTSAPQFLQSIRRPVEQVTRFVATMGVAAILSFAFLTILDVLLRNLFLVTVRGMTEILILVLGVAVAACLPYGFAKNVHLSVDIITSTLPDNLERVLKSIAALILLIFVAVMGGELFKYAATLHGHGQTSLILGWPIAPFFYAMAVLILVCVPIQFFNVIETFNAAFRGSNWRVRALLFAVIALLVLLAGIYTFVGINQMPFYDWFKAQPPVIIAFAFFGLMWIIMLLGAPLAAAMGIVGLLGIAVIIGQNPAASIIGTETGKYLTSEVLAVLPLFLLMGAFATVAGLSADIYRFAFELLKPLRGSLAHATIAGCAGFGALTGSSLATAATFGKVALPEMEERGYDLALAAGSVAAGGTLGSLVPPSTAIILFALLAEQSIGQLFMAAIGPAIFAVALYILTIALLLRLKPGLAPAGAPIDRRALLQAAKKCWGAVVLFGLVIGGIYSGFFTDAEAASVGAGGAFLFALFRGKLGGGRIWSVMAETTTTIALIYTLIFGAVTFSFLIALTQVPAQLSDWIVASGISPLGVVLLLIGAYLLLGMVMDSYAMMVITVPIFLPLVMQNGYDPIWWGILTVICVELGMITPPFGMNIFMLNSLSKSVTLHTIYRGVLPFVAADLVKIGIIIALPAIALWLPAQM